MDQLGQMGLPGQVKESGSFTVSLRVLGNEFIGFSIAADSFSTKWVVLGTLMIVAGAATASIFGPDLVALFHRPQ